MQLGQDTPHSGRMLCAHGLPRQRSAIHPLMAPKSPFVDDEQTAAATRRNWSGHGGGHNLLWRLATTRGTWAIKEVGRELSLDPEATLALELAAHAGGIPAHGDLFRRSQARAEVECRGQGVGIWRGAGHGWHRPPTLATSRNEPRARLDLRSRSAAIRLAARPLPAPPLPRVQNPVPGGC